MSIMDRRQRSEGAWDKIKPITRSTALPAPALNNNVLRSFLEI